jgi:hypothetical protein
MMLELEKVCNLPTVPSKKFQKEVFGGGGE